MSKSLIVLALLIVTIAAPYVLRPADNAQISAGKDTERLIIISPHNESIMSEFSIGFAEHMDKTHGRKVYIDWRQPGGTSEIAMTIKSDFGNAFENHWENKTGGAAFTTPIREGFSDRWQKLPDEVNQLSYLDFIEGDTPTEKAVVAAKASLQNESARAKARELFLNSDVGIGVDLFFGGGAYDFIKQASAGNLVATDASGKYGPGALVKEQPVWFSDGVLPGEFGGEPFCDSEYRWVGTVLSAFGLCYNQDVLERLGVKPFEQWQDLADPRLVGQIALADPTKSGSANKAFEMLIQQKIQQVLQSSQAQASEVIEAEAVREGWSQAMQMILKISANGRYFTDSASKVPHDVAQGESAGGMCIDFYGRTYNEYKKQADGNSRIVFVMPRAGTSIGADPIGMLRGAPNPELAHRFIEYVLSTAGQKLWNFKPGTPGGPKRASLRRPPIRRDFYTPENQQYMSDADVNPYELSEGFTYHGDWTERAFGALRFTIRCACVDTHIEQRRAWRALIDAGMPADALAEFEDVSAIRYDRVMGEINETLRSKNKIKEVELARNLSSQFRKKYQLVLELCKQAPPTAAMAK